jgi:hypothetical protein
MQNLHGWHFSSLVWALMVRSMHVGTLKWDGTYWVGVLIFQ